MTAHLEDQIKAAVTHARTAVARGLGADVPPKAGTSALFEEFWQRHGTGPRCRHLRTRPVQPSHLVAWDGTWRCAPCQGAWGAAGQARMAATGQAPLDPIEDNSCDRCRRWVPNGLTPTVIRQDLWVILAGLCRRCVAEAKAAGGSEVTP